MPELVAAMASTAEIVLPILLAFGLLTRWAALGLLGMTAIIQLTYPDGWANFHLYWAAMALAILTFGPGAISLDRLLGLDGWSARRGLPDRPSPLRIGGENVILVGHDRVAGEAALGVVLLRRRVLCVPGLKVSDAGSYSNSAYPHPPLSANFLLSFTMKSVSCNAPGTIGSPGWSSSFFAIQWIFANLAPSGKGLPLPGMPAL